METKTQLDIDANKHRYIFLLRAINIDGVDDLIHFLESSDFFYAPASTRYHMAVAGGLCQHSLNVYDALTKIADTEPFRNYRYSPDTLILVSLLHDLCKIGIYKPDVRNQKINGAWTQIPCYKYDDAIPYGHGTKSVYIVSAFLRLNREQAMAIRWHMGYSDEHDDRTLVGKAFEQYPLALMLSIADQIASYCLETKENI